MPRVYPRKGTKFCFTRQCGDAEWADECDAMVAAFAGCNRVVFALFNCEISPSTGRRHLQGCFKLDNPRSFEYVIENIMDRGEHVEFCRSWAASVKYCRKDTSQAPDTTPTSYGDVSEEGSEKHGGPMLYAGCFWSMQALYCREMLEKTDDE